MCLKRVFLNLQSLIRKHTEEIALSITTEQGKTLQDARGDIFRGLEIVEMSCNVGSLTMGETAVIIIIMYCHCIMYSDDNN